MEDAEAPPAAAGGRVKRLASSNVAAAIAAAGPARRHEVRMRAIPHWLLAALATAAAGATSDAVVASQSPVTASPPTGGAAGGQASPELPFANAVSADALGTGHARVSPGSGGGGGGAAGRKPAARKPAPARLSDGGGSSDGSGECLPSKAGPGGKVSSMRPTNNQLTCAHRGLRRAAAAAGADAAGARRYMVQLHWEHFHLPLHAAVRATLRDATDQCASVTTAFRQARAAATLRRAAARAPGRCRNRQVLSVGGKRGATHHAPMRPPHAPRRVARPIMHAPRAPSARLRLRACACACAVPLALAAGFRASPCLLF